MKWVIVTALTVGLLGGVTGGLPSNAEEARQRDSRQERQCRFQKLDRATWTPREEWRTAQCVTEKWAVPGGLTTFLRIGQCESGWNRLAWSPAGYAGIFQHDLSSWTYRMSTYEPEWWTLRPRWQNSRTMITISARMMNAVGLSPWSCS